MLNNLQQIESSDLEGPIFIGTVTDNLDPLKLERIKVSIPGLLEEADPSLHPWAGKDGNGFMSSTSTYGFFGLVPRIGDKVWVRFQRGDLLFPLYWASPILNGQRPAEADVNYPNRYGWVDPAGNSVVIDVTAGSTTMEFKHKTGTVIRINNDGSITSSAPTWSHQGTFNLTGDANVTGNFNLTGDAGVTGKIDATDTIKSTTDVLAVTVSLKNHLHGGVTSGGSQTSPPIPT